MYQEHFGLNRAPFKITPDTSLFYEGSRRGAALEALIYAIKSGEGIIKVVGEVGSGKTMLCRMLELRLTETIDVVYIANPSLSPDNILHVIAYELRLDIDSNHSKLEAMQKLQDYLLSKHADNRQVVLFVEEAQSMPVDTLEEIRLLSNLETDQNKLLQMVLFGQPELDEKLGKAEIRQLKERITHSFYLDPFPAEDTREYLNFRLRSVGYRGPDVFNNKTASAVKKYSGGLTRRINIIADKALMASYSEGGHSVTARHVKVAARDSDFKEKINYKKWSLVFGGMVLLAMAIWIGTLIPGYQAARIPGEQDKPVSEPVKSSESTENTAGKADAESDRLSGPALISAMPGEAAFPLLQQRLVSTLAWLENSNPEHYTIQLFLARHADSGAIEEFLHQLPVSLELERIHIYSEEIEGRLKYSVLYNDYLTRQDAMAVIEDLPESLRANHPFPRKVEAIVPQLP